MEYHISWFNFKGDHISEGEKFSGENEIEALKAFRDKYPDAIFLSCISDELVQRKAN